jgi:hypothetical protein
MTTTMRNACNVRNVQMLAAMAILLGASGCGSTGDGDGIPEGQSLVVITVNYGAGVPEVRQIHVAAHLGSAGMDADLYYPTMPGGPIASGATLGLLIPTTRSGLLDLILFGVDASQNPVARGNGQTTINVGGRVEKTITLDPCSSSGPGSGC